MMLGELNWFGVINGSDYLNKLFWIRCCKWHSVCLLSSSEFYQINRIDIEYSCLGDKQVVEQLIHQNIEPYVKNCDEQMPIFITYLYFQWTGHVDMDTPLLTAVKNGNFIFTFTCFFEWNHIGNENIMEVLVKKKWCRCRCENLFEPHGSLDTLSKHQTYINID